VQSAISAINDVVSRIYSLHDPSETGSLILRLEFINRMLVNLEVLLNMLTFLLEQGFNVSVINVMLGVGKQTVERKIETLSIRFFL